MLYEVFYNIIFINIIFLTLIFASQINFTQDVIEVKSIYHNITTQNNTLNFLTVLESIIGKHCKLKKFTFNECLSLYTILNNEIIYNIPSPYTNNNTTSYRRVDHTQQAKRSERLSMFRHKLSKSYDTTSLTSTNNSDSSSVYDTNEAVIEREYDYLIWQEYIHALTYTSTSTTTYTHIMKNHRVMFIHIVALYHPLPLPLLPLTLILILLLLTPLPLLLHHPLYLSYCHLSIRLSLEGYTPT